VNVTFQVVPEAITWDATRAETRKRAADDEYFVSASPRTEGIVTNYGQPVVSAMDYESDDDKAVANIVKHGIDFLDADRRFDRPASA
jgi:hypothetical protein